MIGDLLHRVAVLTVRSGERSQGTQSDYRHRGILPGVSTTGYVTNGTRVLDGSQKSDHE